MTRKNRGIAPAIAAGTFGISFMGIIGIAIAIPILLFGFGTTFAILKNMFFPPENAFPWWGYVGIILLIMYLWRNR